MKPTERENLEKWLKQCHSRKDQLGVAGMLLLFEQSTKPPTEQEDAQVDSVYSLITGGRDKVERSSP